MRTLSQMRNGLKEIQLSELIGFKSEYNVQCKMIWLQNGGVEVRPIINGDELQVRVCFCLSFKITACGSWSTFIAPHQDCTHRLLFAKKGSRLCCKFFRWETRLRSEVIIPLT